MSTRLATGGRLIDRSKPLSFTFNNKRMTGFKGDTLASALLANGQKLVGRSFKYHRPRGIVARGAEEPNALANFGTGANFEPNQRMTTTPLTDQAVVASQNHWPTLEFDVGAINASLSRFLPAGFYYKTFNWPRAFWAGLYEPIIRRSAGLGKAPRQADQDRYEHLYAFCDVLVVGGGVAGLTAATAAAESGDQVILLEQTGSWGGRSVIDGGDVDGVEITQWVKNALQALDQNKNVTIRKDTMGAGIYDHGYVIAYEQTHDTDAPRHRLWRIRAGRIITATGAIERPLSFANNDLPGVMLASAVRDYVCDHGVSPGDRTVIVTNNDDAYQTALALKNAGLEVPVILDARQDPQGPLVAKARALGIRVAAGRGVASVTGKRGVEAVEVCLHAGEGAVLETIPCEAVAMSGGWSPVVHLWSHCGGKLIWDDAQAHFRPDPDRPPTGHDGQAFVTTAGSASGAMSWPEVLIDAHRAGGGQGAAPAADSEDAGPMLPVWVMPQGAGVAKRTKMFLDFQNDVKVSDVQLAAQEGYESVEHAKRYTTLGMATDQGKLSNINGLATLSDALHQPIPQTGTTTFRPPYTPISMASIAGEARGELFQPLRRTPMHDWHAQHGAQWEPVGQWRRPYAYVRAGETVDQAVAREVTATRTSLGLLDASTLGKIIVKGPDAGRFLDMMYTNMISTLPVGKCRYGLMCSENGFLIDDGVVARISDDSWLCHTTTGGAERIHGHMEEWLQTEWWDWNVFTANVTEHWAQIAVVGPNARKTLEKLGDMDVSAAAMPFMTWAKGTLAGIPVRVFRISFSGELSYEVAVPASQGLSLWENLHASGEEFDVTPYGTEALHVLRAEKGFIMIGDESDGTVIPHDLGLEWAISKKKTDYLGKRAQARSHMTDPDRWKLVGLQTLNRSTLPDGAYAVAEGVNENGQRKTEGRVTSTYHSPTLDRGIAMGLVLNGPDRMGEVLTFPGTDGTPYEARIVSPVFFDPEGDKQNV